MERLDYIVGWTDDIKRTPEGNIYGIFHTFIELDDAREEFEKLLSQEKTKGKRLILIKEKWEWIKLFGDFPTTSILQIAQIGSNGKILRSVS